MIILCNYLKTFFSRLLKVVLCVCVCVCVCVCLCFSAPMLYPGRERIVDVALLKGAKLEPRSELGGESSLL